MPADYSFIHVEIIIQDAKGKRGACAFHATIQNSEAGDTISIEDFVQTTAQRLDSLIDGKIVQISARLIIDLPDGLKETPLPTSDREEGALFHFRTGNNASVRMRVPTFSEDQIPTADDESEEFFQFIVIFTNPEVDNFHTYPSSRHFLADGSTDEDIRLLEAIEKSFKSK